MEPADIVRFTEISGDRNPLHYDAALAQRTLFGGLIVQGGVTSVILNAVDIAGEVEVLQVHEDKPITRLRTTVTRQDGVVALEATAVCYTVALEPAGS